MAQLVPATSSALPPVFEAVFTLFGALVVLFVVLVVRGAHRRQRALWDATAARPDLDPEAGALRNPTESGGGG